MGWVEKRSGSWRATFRDPARHRHSRTFDRKVEAERWLRQSEADADRGTFVDSRAAKITVVRAFEDWLDGALDLAPATRAKYASIGRRYVVADLGAVKLGDLRAPVVRGWMADLVARGVGRETLVVARQVLGRVCSQAVADGRMQSSPVVGVELPRPEHRDARVLEPEDVRRIAEHVDDRYRALVLVQAFGGLRLGEALGLRWRNVDLPRQTLRVVEQATEVGGEVRIGQPLKTRGSRRNVMLPAFVAEALAQHAERYGPPEPSTLVFTSPRGGPVRRTNYRRRAWLPALAAAGIDHATPHDLRHFAASAAIASGAHAKAVQSRLGHASITTTMDRYGHLFAGTDAALADALDAYAPSDAEVVNLRASS